MAGRPRKVRSIQSYINNSDAHSGLSMLKAGTPPKVGVTHYLWYNLQTQSNQGPLDFVNSSRILQDITMAKIWKLKTIFYSMPKTGIFIVSTNEISSAGVIPSTFNGNFNSNYVLFLPYDKDITDNHKLYKIYILYNILQRIYLTYNDRKNEYK